MRKNGRKYKRETDEETCKLNEEIRQEQLSEQKKDRYIRIGLDVAGLLVPIKFHPGIFSHIKIQHFMYTCVLKI